MERMPDTNRAMDEKLNTKVDEPDMEKKMEEQVMEKKLDLLLALMKQCNASQVAWLASMDSDADRMKTAREMKKAAEEEIKAAQEEVKAAQERLNIQRKEKTNKEMKAESATIESELEMNSEVFPGEDKQDASAADRDSEIHILEENKLNVVNRRAVQAKKKLRRKKYVRTEKLKKLRQERDVRPRIFKKCHRKRNVRARNIRRLPKQETYPSPFHVKLFRKACLDNAAKVARNNKRVACYRLETGCGSRFTSRCQKSVQVQLYSHQKRKGLRLKSSLQFEGLNRQPKVRNRSLLFPPKRRRLKLQSNFEGPYSIIKGLK